VPPDLTTLDHLADLVIRRVVAEVGRTNELAEALERAYPFGDVPCGRTVWIDALNRQKLAASYGESAAACGAL
jgi:hypothetical protein